MAHPKHEVRTKTVELRVTPLTDFAQVMAFSKPADLNEQFFIRSFPNNGNFQTKFYGHKSGLIFEVIPGQAGQIACI